MRKLPKPRFTLKSPRSKSETLIFLVLRFRGKKLVYSTGMSIRPKDWDFDAQRPIERTRRQDLWMLHRKIDDLSVYCKDIFIKSGFGNITLPEFKEQLDQRVLHVAPEGEDKEQKTNVPDSPKLASECFDLSDNFVTVTRLSEGNIIPGEGEGLEQLTEERVVLNIFPNHSNDLSGRDGIGNLFP